MKLARNVDRVLNWHVLSYPRSGNRLVTTLLDFAARRVFSELPGSGSDDTTRGTRRAWSAALAPVTVKAHPLGDSPLPDFDPRADRLLLVLRDPRDAIASHLSDQMGSRLLVTERQIASATAVELDRLHGLLETVRSYPSHMRLHVNFETLTGAEGSSFAAASALLTEVGLDQAALDEMDWLRVNEIARTGREPPSRRQQRLRQRIRRAAAVRTSRAEVRQFMATGIWPGPAR